MDDLDFTTLTDDQVVGLLRAILRECVTRGGAVQAAAHAAGLDEAERAQVQMEAARREAAKLRAQERERVAKEAAEAVRNQHAAQEHAAQEAGRKAQQEHDAEAAALRAQAARREAAEAVLKAETRDRERQTWLRRFAAAVGRKPGEILLMRADTNRYGWRVILNLGTSRYTSDHLVDYYPKTAIIHTPRSLIAAKRDLIALCAEFWSLNPNAETVYSGADYTWEEETSRAS